MRKQGRGAVGQSISLADLCGPFIDALPVTGASICVFGQQIGHSTVCSSDALARRLDGMQFDLAEGPRWEVARTGVAVLAGALGVASWAGWPVFGERSLALGVGGLFAFPLTLGETAVGVVDLYSLQAGSMTDDMTTLARALAGGVARPALERIGATAEQERPAPSPMTLRREVHQATGMVLVQLGIDADDALAVIRAHAFATERTAAAVAADVVARRLDFSSEPGGFGARDGSPRQMSDDGTAVGPDDEEER